MTYHVINENEWEQMPSGKAKPKESQWMQVLDALKQGKIVSLPVSSLRELRGYRIGLARTAAGQGMKLEFRSTDTHLAVRKAAEPYTPKPQAERQPRGSRKKAAAESAV